MELLLLTIGFATNILVYLFLADRLDRVRFELQEQIDLNRSNIKVLGDIMQKHIKNTEKLCKITEKHIKNKKRLK